MRVNTDDKAGYSGNVDFVTDGNVEFHLARRDIQLGFRMKQQINPLDRGHFCFRTDIPYSIYIDADAKNLFA